MKGEPYPGWLEAFEYQRMLVLIALLVVIAKVAP